MQVNIHPFTFSTSQPENQKHCRHGFGYLFLLFPIIPPCYPSIWVYIILSYVQNPHQTPSIHAPSPLPRFPPPPLFFSSSSPLHSHRPRPLLHTPHTLRRRTPAITIKPRRILPSKLKPKARPTPLPPTPTPTPANRPLPPRPRRRSPPKPRPTLLPHAPVLCRARRRSAREMESKTGHDIAEGRCAAEETAAAYAVAGHGGWCLLGVLSRGGLRREDGSGGLDRADGDGGGWQRRVRADVRGESQADVVAHVARVALGRWNGEGDDGDVLVGRGGEGVCGGRWGGGVGGGVVGGEWLGGMRGRGCVVERGREGGAGAEDAGGVAWSRLGLGMEGLRGVVGGLCGRADGGREAGVVAGLCVWKRCGGGRLGEVGVHA